jgi:hypothetical protein
MWCMQHSVNAVLGVFCTWLVLATCPGNPPAVWFLAGGLVWFGSTPGQKPDHTVLAGLLVGLDINPRFFGWVYHTVEPHFRELRTWAPIKYLNSDRITI